MNRLLLIGVQRLVILGSYGVKVKTAGATIYGASLHPSDNIQWVHAPHCHALPVLRCAENSVIEIYPHPAAPGLREMERLSPLFGNLWNEFSPGGEAEKQTWQILASSADGLKRAILQDLKSPAIWNKKIADLLKTKQGPAPVILVCGPKSSGKSTFTRIITNKLVTDRGGTKKRKWPGVAVLDIDPGQPEFSPPGVISLVTLEEPNLSPPVCHPILGTNHIVRSHTVASINPASDIEHYKNCVLELFSRYRVTCTKRPLIINTPGWVQGSGLVLLQDLVSAMRPTEVLYMSEDGPEDTVEGIKSACNSTAFTALPSQSSEYTSRTAQHLRHMQAMSYFHADAEAAAVGNHAAGPRWDPRPLATAPPWLVRYDAGGSVGDGAGLLGMLCYGYQPEPELLAEAVNGTVLAIVEIEDPRAFATSEAVVTNPADPGRQTTAITTAITTTTPERLSYLRPAAPLDPRFSRCIGLALVRGLDADRRLLALSTPVRLDVDIVSGGGAVVLVSGKFDPPTWAYTEDHYHSSSYRGGGDEEEAAGEEEIPWAERLRGGEKRAAGSRVWRVRRDLGRGGAATGE